jgi:hypothetical protein
MLTQKTEKGEKLKYREIHQQKCLMLRRLSSGAVYLWNGSHWIGFSSFSPVNGGEWWKGDIQLGDLSVKREAVASKEWDDRLYSWQHRIVDSLRSTNNSMDHQKQCNCLEYAEILSSSCDSVVSQNFLCQGWMGESRVDISSLEIGR